MRFTREFYYFSKEKKKEKEKQKKEKIRQNVLLYNDIYLLHKEF